MGLDMSLYKINKKMDEETFNEVMSGRRYDTEEEEFMKSAERVLNIAQGNCDCVEMLDFFKENLNEGFVGRIFKEPISEEEFINKQKEMEEERTELDYSVSYEEYVTCFKQEIERLKQNLYIDLSNRVSIFNKQKENFLKHKDLIEELGDSKEIAYWRKHSDLNGYMEDLYYNNGGEGTFNCIPLYLDKYDIEDIISNHEMHLNDSEDFEIPIARGFFWGETDREDWENSLEDFKRVLKETDWENETVYYHCWW